MISLSRCTGPSWKVLLSVAEITWMFFVVLMRGDEVGVAGDGSCGVGDGGASSTDRRSPCGGQSDADSVRVWGMVSVAESWEMSSGLFSRSHHAYLEW